MGNCCRRKTSIGPISVLLLGGGGAGKTEIGYALCGQPRIDFGSTKGVHVFNVNTRSQIVRMTEIGGSDSVRDIWHHYYNDAFGTVFVIDCSLDAPFEKMRDVLHKFMHNQHIRGKPLLIVAKKQDLDQYLDTYFFRIDELCNLLRTPCRIVTSGAADRSDIYSGMEWLVDAIVDNYKSLKNRMRFNDLFTSPIKRFERERTSLPKKISTAVQSRRIRSTPSKIVARRTTKVNGFINPVKIHGRAQQVAPIIPVTPAAHSPHPSIFRLNTVAKT